jgi:hypothetical protein
MTTIIGAGLSGLIAATQFPDAQVFEAHGPEHVAHKALLRFRSEEVSRLLGIPFRKVMVRKSIFANGRHEQPSIESANRYSRKTNGRYLDRSIWNLTPCDRFIAPEDFISKLIDKIGLRVHWNSPIQPEELDGTHPVISTIPMPILAAMLGIEVPDDHFRYKSIVVDRYRVAGADLYQTVYYPDTNHPVYRASMTGDMLIVESVTSPTTVHDPGVWGPIVYKSLGISACDVEIVESHHVQRFGKISPIDERWRKDFIYTSSLTRQVYSLGRFATWRNILLDDLVNDIDTIKTMMEHGGYSATIQHHRNKEQS